MKVIIGGRLVRAAGLLMLLFLAGRVDASVRCDNGSETVYRGGQQPCVRNSPFRHVRRHHRAGSQVNYNDDVIGVSDDAPVSVPDGGSTLAMFGSAVLLLLGYHRLRCQRIAA
jgi:hypothetical protein